MAHRGEAIANWRSPEDGSMGRRFVLLWTEYLSAYGLGLDARRERGFIEVENTYPMGYPRSRPNPKVGIASWIDLPPVVKVDLTPPRPR